MMASLGHRASMVLVCVAAAIAGGCAGSRSANEGFADARQHIPHGDSDARENPYVGVNSAGEMESFFREYHHERFAKGLRMGMSESELVRLAERPARKRLTGTVGEEEFTFTWPREDTGFRVMMRDGRAIGWMSERAILLEPERLRPSRVQP